MHAILLASSLLDTNLQHYVITVWLTTENVFIFSVTAALIVILAMKGSQRPTRRTAFQGYRN